MNLKNILKKETKNSKKVNVEKLDKNQLEKVIGGGDPNASNPTMTTLAIRSFNKAY